jgi:hypothetical protein
MQIRVRNRERLKDFGVEIDSLEVINKMRVLMREV